MTEKLPLCEKAWQNTAYGITQMDLDRLTEIALIMETPLMDLINAQESFYVHQLTSEQGVSVNNGEVTINNDVSEHDRALFKEVLAYKDAQIAALQVKYDALVAWVADKL